jgi:hypothetical protein
MKTTCLLCGSDKIIPNRPMIDHYGDWGMSSHAQKFNVDGKPNAWFFKESAQGELVADICGECGHVMLRVNNAHELYEKYQQAQR